MFLQFLSVNKDGHSDRLWQRQTSRTYCLSRCLYLPLQPARALLVDCQELLSEFFEQLVSGRGIDVHEPFLVLRRQGDFVVGPFASLKK